jgi:hypothetical protein
MVTRNGKGAKEAENCKKKESAKQQGDSKKKQEIGANGSGYGREGREGEGGVYMTEHPHPAVLASKGSSLTSKSPQTVGMSISLLVWQY